ncbi:N-acetylneuraminate synthase [Butyrivibrio fibrisolvens DSM 3071]|uniref:N-acetylneuraminate synthase n=1 Tax=Butyrivibrio fibrisolvens DSM 3071 TaxID=1121131 RepID=A0A1M5XU58_BUTFI|nr:pseudaminic acid synthase [Butyrivibrio fibrisolvens]SHI03337.1 N-acetylneuraminate synthase [Butyrivibrio fibrisolvens DSM 3071]
MFKKCFKIGNKAVGSNDKTFIVAELSGNHNGDYNRAVEIIHAAAEAGADAVKLQTYTADTITIDCNKPWFMTSAGSLWEGRTLYDLYKEAYTPWEWHEGLIKEANKLGLECFSSPFDPTAVDYLENLNVPAYKIASFEINDIPLIRKVARLHKPIIFATGIAYEEDIRLALDTCLEEQNENIILLKCVSAYPTPYDMVNLRMMEDLAEKYDCLVGLSDHTLGSVVATGSVALGGKMIEKHLTLDRKAGGVDDAFSMEPKEFAEMVRNVRIMEQALGQKEYELSDKQAAERHLSRSLFVVKDIKAGEQITTENVRSIRPGNGMHTKHYEEVLGMTAVNDIEKGTPLSWDLIR